MKDPKLSMPTVSGLKSYQASLFAKKYFEIEDWIKVRAYAYEENLFDTSRKATSDRYSANVIKMLSVLDSNQLRIVAYGYEKDRVAMLWLGFCLSFPLIGEFVYSVVCEKYNEKNFILKTEDLWEFLANKSVKYNEIQNISDSVRIKVKSVIFTNLRDAGYINRDDELMAANLSDSVKEAIDSKYLSLFPGENA